MTARERLWQIIRILCRFDGNDRALRSGLTPFLARGTTINDLTFPHSKPAFSWEPPRPLDIEQFKLSAEILWEDQAKILITRSGEPLPYMAHLQKHNEEWRLRAFLFQCPGCFGTGVILDEPCGCCGAKGWGGADF
jgi:hypothetical protein